MIMIILTHTPALADFRKKKQARKMFIRFLLYIYNNLVVLNIKYNYIKLTDNKCSHIACSVQVVFNLVEEILGHELILSIKLYFLHRLNSSVKKTLRAQQIGAISYRN